MPWLIRTVALLSRERSEGSASRGFVISWHDRLKPVWQFAQPGIEVCDLGWAAGERREIASVDQDVAIRHLDVAMKLMCIAEEDKAQ
jgi:hypothetical protein